MENLLTNKTASMTELRDPKKVVEKAGDKPVAILNRNQLEGYFVPAAAVLHRRDGVPLRRRPVR